MLPLRISIKRIHQSLLPQFAAATLPSDHIVQHPVQSPTLISSMSPAKTAMRTAISSPTRVILLRLDGSADVGISSALAEATILSSIGAAPF
jgi:hypothetical protein